MVRPSIVPANSRVTLTGMLTITRVFLSVVAFLLIPNSLSAQTGTYIAATGFADIRQFGSTPFIPYGGDDFALNATSAGGGLRIGTFLHPRWSLELSGDATSRASVEYENPIRILIFPPPPPMTLEASTSFITVSTMIGFHPEPAGRVRLAYRAGFSFVRGTYESHYPSFVVPASTGLFTWSSNVLGELAPFGLTPVPRPSIIRTTTKQKHNAGALTLGFDAGVDITSRVGVVPEVRALVFSAPVGSTVFLIRPGIGVRWRF